MPRIGSDPGGAAVLADVAVAGVAGRAGAALVLHAVLVVLERHRVGAERGQLDPVAAAGVLHPVLVQRVPAVELVGRVEEVPVELRDLLARDGAGLGARVGEHRRALRLRHDERLVGVVEQHQRAPEAAHGPADVGIGPVRARRLAVVEPRHVVRVHPVLRVDRLRRLAAAEPQRAGRSVLLPGLLLRPVVVPPGPLGIGGGCRARAPGEKDDYREQERRELVHGTLPKRRMTPPLRRDRTRLTTGTARRP
jgi:hypothetical protein